MTPALQTLLTLLFGLALLIGAIIVLRRLGRKRQMTFLRFQQEGIKVTGNLTQVRRLRGMDSSRSQLRHRRISGRYTYYIFPGGTKYLTRRYTAPNSLLRSNFMSIPKIPAAAKCPGKNPRVPALRQD